MSTAPNFFVTGGTVPANAASYVERRADTDLLSALLAGDYCFVLNSRQMGKSSLSVRTIGKLEAAGVQTAFLDLTRIGAQNVTVEQWYAGLLVETGRELECRTELLTFWRTHTHLPPVQRFFTALREIMLEKLDSKIVIFIDEIDAVRSLSFPADEFFAAVRACYNSRTQDDVYKRLTFCLVGAATPADLISDTRMSPFNVGRRIELRDFTPSEAAPLAEHLLGGKPTLDRILHWTGGQPYLTQRLCRAVVEEPGVSVDQLCDGLFLAKSAQESDDNISFVRNRLLKSEVDLASLLDLYGKVRSGKRVRDDETNPLCGVLRLSGACKLDKDYLVIRNRIYDHVFDKNWVLSHMPDAELGRQKEAYRRGILRTAALSSVVFLGMAGLTGWAIKERGTAKLNAQNTAKAKVLAERYFANANLQLAAQMWETADGSAGAVRSLLGDYQPDSFTTNSFAWRYQWTQLNQCGGDCLDFPASGSPIRGSAFLADGSLWTLNLGGILTYYAANQTTPSKTIALSKLVPSASPNAYALSPKGDVAFVGTTEGKVAVVDIASQRVTKWLIVDEKPNAIGWLTVAPEGDNIAAVDAKGGRWLVWNQETGTLLHRVPFFALDATYYVARPQSLLVTSGPNPRIACRYFTECLLLPVNTPKALPNADTVLRDSQHLGKTRDAGGIWDFSDPRWAVGEGQSMVLSPEGSRAATPDNTGKVIIWDVKSNKGLLKIDAHAVSVMAVTFSHDGKRLATSGEDGAIRVWDAQKGTLLRSFKGQTTSVSYLSFSPDDSHLLSADEEGGLRLWSLKDSPRVVQTKAGPVAMVDLKRGPRVNFPILSQQFSADSKTLLVANFDLVELGISVQGGTQERYLSKLPDIVSGADMKAALKLPPTATNEDMVKAIASKQGSQKFIQLAPIAYARFTPDGRSVLAGLSMGDILVTYDRATGKKQVIGNGQGLNWTGHGFNSLSCFTYAPDGKSVVLGFGNRSGSPEQFVRTVAVLDASTGKEVQTLTGFNDNIYDICFSADGKTLAIACFDGTLSFYQKKGNDWALTYRHDTINVPPTALAFSPDGKRLAVGSSKGRVELLDTTKPTYPVLHSLLGHSAFIVGGLAFSPDGTTLASGCWDQTVKLWDTVTGRELRTLYGHKNWVQSVAFSPDGNTLVSGDADGRILLWRAATATQIAQTEDSKILKQVLQMQEAERVDKPLITKFLARYPDDTDVKQRYQQALLAPELQAARRTAREATDLKDYARAAKAYLTLCRQTKTSDDCLNAASAFLLAGDTKGYQQLCNEILEYTKGASVEETALFLATCSITPEVTIDPAACRRLAERCRPELKRSEFIAFNSAVGLYRLGEYQEALAQFRKEPLEMDTPNKETLVLVNLYLSCVYAKLGKVAEGKAAYEKASVAYKGFSDRPINVDAQWLTIGKEARGLLKLPEPAGL
nr:AAA-like domain-containing protein [Armatimonas sp.]